MGGCGVKSNLYVLDTIVVSENTNNFSISSLICWMVLFFFFALHEKSKEEIINHYFGSN